MFFSKFNLVDFYNQGQNSHRQKAINISLVGNMPSMDNCSLYVWPCKWDRKNLTNNVSKKHADLKHGNSKKPLIPDHHETKELILALVMAMEN